MNVQHLILRFYRKGREILSGTKDSTDVWRHIIHRESVLWNSILQLSNKSSTRVLLATSLGGFDQGVMLESVLSVALTLRRTNVNLLLCNEFLPACQMTKIAKISPEQLVSQGQRGICYTCFKYGKRIISPLGIPVRYYSDYVTEEQIKQVQSIAASIPIAEVNNYQYEGLAVGEHAVAGTLRYYGRGDLNNEPLAEPILRRYLTAALLTVFCTRALIKRYSYDVVCFHHGIYVPQGLIGEVCRNQGVRVVNWNSSYRKQTFIFSHNDSYHHTMISEPTSVWENIEWTTEREKQTIDYLKSRWHGTQDWIWFHPTPQEEIAVISHKLGVDFTRPCIGMLTSVMWDAQLHYKSNAFVSQLDWVIKTIEYFRTRPDLQLIVRIHPAEITGLVPSRQPMMTEITSRFPQLPVNVFIIPPKSNISTYAVMEKCNAVIIYNTKTGIEISSMGIPVIVAGEAWIRNKGFSYDASSPEDYYRILNSLPLPTGLSTEMKERARKYAYHFFYRRMIKLPFIISPEKFRFAIDINSVQDLAPEKNPGLDIICTGILNKEPFIYDTNETVGATVTPPAGNGFNKSIPIGRGGG